MKYFSRSGSRGHKYFVMMLHVFIFIGPWAEVFCNDVNFFS